MLSHQHKLEHLTQTAGIRNYVARNNLRAMNDGDLAFFYHSNCKTPGIVGTMEIVREFSEDSKQPDPRVPCSTADFSRKRSSPGNALL